MSRPRTKRERRITIALSQRELDECRKCAELAEISMAEVLREGIRRMKRQLEGKGKWQ